MSDPDKHETLTKCLTSVVDGEPALNQHWIPVSVSVIPLFRSTHSLRATTFREQPLALYERLDVIFERLDVKNVDSLLQNAKILSILFVISVF